MPRIPLTRPTQLPFAPGFEKFSLFCSISRRSLLREEKATLSRSFVRRGKNLIHRYREPPLNALRVSRGMQPAFFSSFLPFSSLNRAKKNLEFSVYACNSQILRLNDAVVIFIGNSCQGIWLTFYIFRNASK